MKRLAGILVVVAVLALSMGFAALNGGQRITLRLGVLTLYRLPLTVVVFGSVILGMLVMLVAGIRSDLRVRRILRDRLAREDEEERSRIFVDQAQQDLFDPPPGERPARDPSERRTERREAIPPAPSVPAPRLERRPEDPVPVELRSRSVGDPPGSESASPGTPTPDRREDPPPDP